MTDLTASLNALIALSEKATPEHWKPEGSIRDAVYTDEDYLLALSPSIVRALAEVALAADRVTPSSATERESMYADNLDAALARLAAALGGR